MPKTISAIKAIKGRYMSPFTPASSSGCGASYAGTVRNNAIAMAVSRLVNSRAMYGISNILTLRRTWRYKAPTYLGRMIHMAMSAMATRYAMAMFNRAPEDVSDTTFIPATVAGPDGNGNYNFTPSNPSDQLPYFYSPGNTNPDGEKIGNYIIGVNGIAGASGALAYFEKMDGNGFIINFDGTELTNKLSQKVKVYSTQE